MPIISLSYHFHHFYFYFRKSLHYLLHKVYKASHHIKYISSFLFHTHIYSILTFSNQGYCIYKRRVPCYPQDTPSIKHILLLIASPALRTTHKFTNFFFQVVQKTSAGIPQTATSVNPWNASSGTTAHPLSPVN